MQILYRDMYTDSADRKDSVKYFINTETFLQLSSGQQKQVDFFLRKGDLQEKNAVTANPPPR